MRDKETSGEKNGCGTKHLKLMLAIVVVMFMALVAMGTGLTSAQTSGLKEHDERIRAVEQSGAVIEGRLDGIQRSLDRIERTIEKGASP